LAFLTVIYLFEHFVSFSEEYLYTYFSAGGIDFLFLYIAGNIDLEHSEFSFRVCLVGSMGGEKRGHNDDMMQRACLLSFLFSPVLLDRSV